MPVWMSEMSQRILIVDDEAPIRFALARYFGSLGCRVDTAASVAETLGLVMENEYAAAIIDVRLAHVDAGLEVADAIRARNPETKLLMLTAYGSSELEADARDRGVDAFLNKPKPLAEVASALERLLGGPLGVCQEGEPEGETSKEQGRCT